MALVASDQMRSTSPLDDDVAAFMRDPRLRDDPYPMYRRLQDTGPLRFRPMRAWLVTRYADVVQVLRHPAASCDEQATGRSSWRTTSASGIPLLFRHLAMFRRDPPDHTRVRSLVARAFGPRVITGLLPRIQALADEILDPLEGVGQMELYRDYAYPLPLAVIAGLFGIPDDDFPRFREMVGSLGVRFGVNQIRSPGARRRGDDAEAELVCYFDRLIDERRGNGADDFMSTLVSLALDAGGMSRDELIANCIFVALGGHETTARLLCNAVHGLLRDPTQRLRLATDPTFGKPAVEELCRWEPTVQIAARTMLDEVDVGGVTIPQGHVVWAFVGAASRDEREFNAPGTLDLERSHNPHLAFGTGIHTCVGATLARAEIEIGLSTLFRRLPGLELGLDDVRFNESITLRGPERLPLRWLPARALPAR